MRLGAVTLLVLIVFSAAACGSPVIREPTETPGATEEPFTAPDFTLTALDDTSYTLSELRGRWVLVNFWATWCEPCKREMPLFQQLAEAHADTLTVLAINQREDAAAVAAFGDEYGLSFPLLLNPDDATVMAYQVIGLPQTLIVNPSGEVVFRQFGPVSADDLAILE